MMTEKEAKTKWCPHAVASHTDPRARTAYANEQLGLPEGTFVHACIGSACMAWRAGGSRMTDQTQDTVTMVATGYCGLAGVPQ